MSFFFAYFPLGFWCVCKDFSVNTAVVGKKAHSLSIPTWPTEAGRRCGERWSYSSASSTCKGDRNANHVFCFLSPEG